MYLKTIANGLKIAQLLPDRTMSLDDGCFATLSGKPKASTEPALYGHMFLSHCFLKLYSTGTWVMELCSENSEKRIFSEIKPSQNDFLQLETPI